MNRIKWFDAVRAFGLFLVLGYHMFYNLLPSGFVGVDIFFTFSGFLVTALFIDQIRKKGGFELLSFYNRRLQRIAIPLVFSVILTLPIALLISPDFTVGISRHVAATLSFMTNWHSIITGSSYEAQLLPQMYIHTWSLAILMQFYIAWGAVLALFAIVSKVISKVIFKNNERKRHILLKALIILVSGFLAVFSYLYMLRLYNSGSNLNVLYFNTLARSFPFFIGSAAAAVWGVSPEQDKVLGDFFFSKRPALMTAVLIMVLLIATAVILLFLSQRSFDDSFIFHYGFLLTSFLSVVLIYSAHGLHILTPPEVNEPLPLTMASEMSYDLYLLHWPFYIVSSALILDNVMAAFAALAASWIVSALMVYGIERIIIPQNITENVKERAKKYLPGGASYRWIVTVVVAVIFAGVIAAGAVVLARAPIMTSIESDFAAGTISGDVSGIVSLRRGIAALDDPPVLYAGGGSQLRGDLLPAPAPLGDADLPPDQRALPPPAPASETPPEPTSRLPRLPEGVTLIGDSVPLGAKSTMINNIPYCYVNAEVNRTIRQGLNLLREIQNRNELREYVIIALGTNGTQNYADLLTQIIDSVNQGHRLILVTPFDGRTNNNSILTNATTEWMRELPSQYDFITIADWNRTANANVGLLAGDRVHMGGAPSMELYTQVITAAIEKASQSPPKG